MRRRVGLAMPQVFKFGGYRIYFWVNEGRPTEPVHVHVVEGEPRPNATKVWITEAGGAFLANNASEIPAADLADLLDLISAQSELIVEKWLSVFGSVSYYC